MKKGLGFFLDCQNLFKNILLNRPLFKLLTMTIPYNITLYGARSQMISNGFFIEEFETLYNVNKNYSIKYYRVSDSLLKDPKLELKLNKTQFNLLTEILYDSVYNIVPSLKCYKQFLDDLSHLIITLNLPLIWTTPAGMVISYIFYKKTMFTATELLPRSKNIKIKKGEEKPKSITIPLYPDSTKHKMDNPLKLNKNETIFYS